MKKFDPATSLESAHELGAYNGVNQSINDSATFAFEDGNAMEACFHGEGEGAFLYSHLNLIALIQSLASNIICSISCNSISIKSVCCEMNTF